MESKVGRLGFWEDEAWDEEARAYWSVLDGECP
jgi:hypothetical protein